MVSQTGVRSARRAPSFGGVVWLVIGVGWAVGIVDLTTVRWLLMLAPLVVVPLALDLVRWRDPRAERLRHAARALIPIAALAATVSITLSAGPAAGALAVVWLGACSAVALSALLELMTGRLFTVATLLRAAACAYLAFGAGWLVLSRLEIRPLDFSDAIVELTSVHFHFTGFGALLIAASAASFARRGVEARAATGAAFGIVAAMPVIALGITFLQSIETVGTNLLALSMISLAVAHASILRRDEVLPLQRALLAISSLTILAGMGLAIQWALGLQFGTPSLSIDQMAKTHGVLNSLGFVMCGLLAWRAIGSTAEGVS